MRVVDIAGERPDDLVLAVEHHVEDESQSGHLGRRHHVAMDEVALEHAGARPPAVHECAVVVVHDRLI